MSNDSWNELMVIAQIAVEKEYAGKVKCGSR